MENLYFLVERFGVNFNSPSLSFEEKITITMAFYCWPSCFPLNAIGCLLLCLPPLRIIDPHQGLGLASFLLYGLFSLPRGP